MKANKELKKIFLEKIKDTLETIFKKKKNQIKATLDTIHASIYFILL